MKRVMWIEYKGDNNRIVGPARVGWVKVLDNGKRLEYREQKFRTLRGAGFKSNYYDIDTREHYWISGCRKDGRDALYSTDVEVDHDALQEYWIKIRQQPKNVTIQMFSALGKNARFAFHKRVDINARGLKNVVISVDSCNCQSWEWARTL